MSKPAAEEKLPPEDFHITLEEFCMRQSAVVASVEMLAGFCADERAAGRVKDAQAKFTARYAAFARRPA